ncbi:MAG: class I SAM-dependent methyltransferase [Bacteroidales bacterium]|jgi:2-polyprenyl-3-methyl-5-hydroxy-6-metoxy-1,4-benzoquinol methylase
MKQWYEELFEDFADGYDREVFTQGTIGEVDFFEKEAGFDKSLKILDVGCGTGRHAIELASRGYSVTGIDLSEAQLAKARKTAASRKLDIPFFRKDARDFNFKGEFDLAIMICEGAFPLMETDEMNFRILQNACNSLRSGGKLIFTTLNGLFPLFHSVKDFVNAGSSGSVSSANTFDMMTFRDLSTYEATDDHGKKKLLTCNERYYVPSEINWLLKSLGFSQINICGCKLGAFSREDVLTTEDFEMLVIAVKERDMPITKAQKQSRP